MIQDVFSIEEGYVPFQRVTERDAQIAVFFSRFRSADATIPLRKLAHLYGVGVPLISMIRSGRIWKSITNVVQE